MAAAVHLLYPNNPLASREPDGHFASEETARVNRKVISVTDLRDRGGELRYWLRQPARKRLAALELLRQSAHAYDPDTARVSRFLAVVDERKSN